MEAINYYLNEAAKAEGYADFMHLQKANIEYHDYTGKVTVLFAKAAEAYAEQVRVEQVNKIIGHISEASTQYWERHKTHADKRKRPMFAHYVGVLTSVLVYLRQYTPNVQNSQAQK